MQYKHEFLLRFFVLAALLILSCALILTGCANAPGFSMLADSFSAGAGEMPAPQPALQSLTSAPSVCIPSAAA